MGGRRFQRHTRVAASGNARGALKCSMLKRPVGGQCTWRVLKQIAFRPTASPGSKSSPADVLRYTHLKMYCGLSRCGAAAGVRSPVVPLQAGHAQQPRRRLGMFGRRRGTGGRRGRPGGRADGQDGAGGRRHCGRRHHRGGGGQPTVCRCACRCCRRRRRRCTCLFGAVNDACCAHHWSCWHRAAGHHSNGDGPSCRRVSSRAPGSVTWGGCSSAGRCIQERRQVPGGRQVLGGGLRLGRGRSSCRQRSCSGDRGGLHGCAVSDGRSKADGGGGDRGGARRQ